MKIARLQIYEDSEAANLKLLWTLTNGIEYVNSEYWKISGIHLELVYLVKLLSNR